MTEIDWAAIERDYRAGRDSLRAIGLRHGISHVSINKRAKRDGWVRDLSHKIAEKANELVTKAAVTTPVTNISPVTEREIIEANAQQAAHLITQQRADLVELRTVELQLMAELATLSGNQELVMQIGEIMAAPDEAGIDKMNDAYHKVISLPSRVDVLKKITEIREKRINLERKVFRLEDEKPENPFDDLIKAIQGRSVIPGTFKEIEGEVLDGDHY